MNLTRHFPENLIGTVNDGGYLLGKGGPMSTISALGSGLITSSRL
jgi:hypothetical protein